MKDILGGILADSVRNSLTTSSNEIRLIDNDEKRNLKIAYIRRVTLTPTKIIFHFPEPNFTNRVTRQFNADNFIRARFRDEDMRKLNSTSTLSSDMTLVYSRILNFLLNGLKIDHRSYEFLAMSSSQLREHGCWLYASSPPSNNTNAASVRKRMGDFSSIQNVGKYAARLGQSLSSSIETFETVDYDIINDIETACGKYVFTDGIGKISMQKAKEISEKYYKIHLVKNNIPFISAFQIRFGGMKGVVSVDPSLGSLLNHHLQFRPSMKKFESIYNKLDVLNCANYIPCYLNRQVINILSSLGVADSVFSNLQDKMLIDLSEMLIDKQKAEDKLLKYYRGSFSALHSTNSLILDYTQEPFYRQLLKTIYYKSLQNLIKKSRIFIEKGRILMGCIDETQTLKEDEVFIQCSWQAGELAKKNVYLSEVLDLGHTFVVDRKIIGI